MGTLTVKTQTWLLVFKLDFNTTSPLEIIDINAHTCLPKGHINFLNEINYSLRQINCEAEQNAGRSPIVIRPLAPQM